MRSRKSLGTGGGSALGARPSRLRGRRVIDAFPGNGNPRDVELVTLRKEVKKLREDREILRKAVAIFSNHRSGLLRTQTT
jgi:transposase-like protein